jgi:hypothetical protein
MTTQAPRVAIITGSSRGIGASIAKRLAANRITVIVNYAARAADADQVVTDITAQGGKAVAIQADVSVPAQVAALFDPKDADPKEVARAIVKIVETPPGKRPFRVRIDPSQDGAEIVNGVADRLRSELLRRMGLEDLLSPSHELPSGRI